MVTLIYFFSVVEPKASSTVNQLWSETNKQTPPMAFWYVGDQGLLDVKFEVSGIWISSVLSMRFFLAELPFENGAFLSSPLFSAEKFWSMFIF